MNTAVAILAIIGAVLCAPPDFGGEGGPFGRGGPGGRGGPDGRGGRGGRGHHHGPPPPPYLRNVTQEARREYFDIVRNMNATFAQQKEQILQWGEKYGIKDQVEQFNTNMTNLRNEMKKNVTELINQLPEALQKFSTLMENENQTPIELRTAIFKLNAENPRLYRVLKFSFDQFMPRHGPHGPHGPGPRGGRGGARGPGGPGGPFGPEGPEGPGEEDFGGFEQDDSMGGFQGNQIQGQNRGFGGFRR
ncbi:hypothetical protein ANCCEY_09565 [Ancylostoma ceylanicum]|uniref:SXP/RAL-2 family protein Ani s 5-like cation-binding domain-containing protein n=2 Tax=Ancylostoma ceylanicum TaxID=53326 RepID=A0A0D6LUN1_9BILA|nr:hypothetical protein ANCCEY_09565 [Ancylostoma ceylanicum]EYB89318.1 hypothetical protein Y032_0233g3096 [Ancylostoma ceylanicum]